MRVRFSGIILGAIAGVFLGGGTGIVGAFGGVAGVYVFATLGAVIGFFAAPDAVKLWKRLNKK